MTTPPLPSIAPRAVTIVGVDDARTDLLKVGLEERGWTVRTERDGRRALRRWAEELASPLLFLELGHDDLGAFELLAGIAAHRIAPRVVVEAPVELADALRPLGVQSVLPPRCRLAEVAEALEALRNGSVIRAA